MLLQPPQDVRVALEGQTPLSTGHRGCVARGNAVAGSVGLVSLAHLIATSKSCMSLSSLPHPCAVLDSCQVCLWLCHVTTVWFKHAKRVPWCWDPGGRSLSNSVPNNRNGQRTSTGCARGGQQGGVNVGTFANHGCSGEGFRLGGLRKLIGSAGGCFVGYDGKTQSCPAPCVMERALQDPSTVLPPPAGSERCTSSLSRYAPRRVTVMGRVGPAVPDTRGVFGCAPVAERAGGYCRASPGPRCP